MIKTISKKLTSILANKIMTIIAETAPIINESRLIVACNGIFFAVYTIHGA